MSAASGLTVPATVARMRGRPGSSLLLIAEAGLRLTLVELGAALVLAVALRAQGMSTAGLPATWLWVLVRAGLGPDLAAGSVVTGLGAAPLGLTFLVLAVAFRLGQRLGPPPWAALAALPAALAGVALALFTGSALGVPGALLAAVPGALALAAGSEWWRRQGAGAVRSSSVLRAGMAAAAATGAGLLLAGVVAALLRVFAAGGFLKVPTEVVVLAGFWPAAAVNAVAGAPAVGLLLGLVGPALFLTTRSGHERVLFAAIAGAALSVVALAGAESWPTAVSGAAVAWACAGVAAAAAPILGNTAAGHRLAGIGPLRGFGDRLPPPAASELTSERMRPAGTAARGRRETPASYAVAFISALTAILCVVAVLAVTLAGSSAGAAEPADAQAARVYVGALATNDPGRIWSAVVVDGTGAPAGDHLLGRDDLARMLAVAGNRHQRIGSVTLVPVTRDAGQAVYQVAYQEGGDFRSAKLTLRPGAGGWKVVLGAAAIAVPALPAAVKLEVDGTPITGVAAGRQGAVSVLPGVHAVREMGTAPFGDRSIQVTADLPLPALAQPDLAPALDPTAATAARNFAAALIQACAAGGSARPDGCPNQVDAPSGSTVTWTPLGSPDDAALALDEQGNTVIRAHYQLVAAYAVHVPEDTKHVAVGGGFAVAATYAAGAWKAGARPQPAAFDAPRPAAADGALLAAAGAGFDACAASKLLRPADCPQGLPSQGFVGGVQWKLSGDPIAGATIAFDAQRSLFSITGTYAMTVGYTEAGVQKSNTVSGPYRADLFWDGAKPVLVAIAKG